MPVKYCVWKKMSDGRMSVMGCYLKMTDAKKERARLLKKHKNLSPKDIIIKIDRW